MTADVPSRIGVRDVGCLRPGRLRLVDHRLEHLRRGDHGAAALEGARDDALLQQRHVRGADLDAEVAPRHHHGVRLGQDLVESGDRLGLLDLGDHVGRGAACLDQGAERPHVGCGANERESDEVDIELHRELEVFEILARDRRNRKRYAGQVDTLVRRDDAADDHLTAGPSAFDCLDTKLHVAVVDEHVVADLEHRAEHRGADRQVTVASRCPRRR